MLRILPRKVRLGLAVLVLLPVLSGCGPAIRKGNPRPNLALAPESSSMKLVLGPNVADTLDVPAPSSAFRHRARVEDWHATLTNAFQNGFAAAYQLVPSSAESDFVLQLDEVELEMVPVPMGPAVALSAQIRFRATLVDPSGAQRLAVGTVESKKATLGSDANPIVVSAVESMYEDIARQLFAHPAAAAPAGSPPSPASPSQSFL